MNVENRPSLSVYLHIPFCGVKCSYCAFNTYVHLDHLIAPFVQALCEEIRVVGGQSTTYDVHTVFLGGGTPSLLTPPQLECIITALHAHFRIEHDAEITMESNPADLTREYCTAVRALGINRLSIGMQSANETELRLFDRRHDNETVMRAVAAARAGGFDNLNLDLIYGAPHQTLETWRETLQEFIALKPEHASLYALSLEEGTSMKAWVDRGKLPTPDDDLAADMYDLATEMLEASGYEQYEISNWTQPGRACRHNLQYWYNLDYVGLGPGAHGFADAVRYAVIKSPVRYIEALKQPTHSEFPRTAATDYAEALSRDDIIAETLIMNLRLTQAGIDRAQFKKRFGVDLVDLHREPIERHTRGGLLEVDDARVRLTDKGRMLSNVVFREFV
ncbi:MAG: radical SAM family heme chaperone HemW [Chloroflexota bacterium]|nr:radical SAM family heme chaperone HemW [Chloroflexota bacterium]